MYKINMFTPYLDVDFNHCSEQAVVRGEVLSAHCIVVVCSQDAVLSLSAKKLQLSVVPIETSIGNAVQCALHRDFGLNTIENQCVLFGKFGHGLRHPPTYVVGYFMSMPEGEGVLRQPNIACFDPQAVSRAESVVPNKLLRLIMASESKRGLGYDENGQLVHWTLAVEEKILADLEEQRLKAEEEALNAVEKRRETQLLAV